MPKPGLEPALGTDAYSILFRRIVGFRLLPGEFLSENRLAGELGFSRTPVREALDRLAAQGCVEVFPQRGTQVSRISAQRVRQAVFLRTVLERSVLSQLCASPPSEEQLARLSESLTLQRRLLEQGADLALLEEDIRMHGLLYRFCGREAALDVFSVIHCDMLRICMLQLRTFTRLGVPSPSVYSWAGRLVEHRMLLDALRRRDAEALGLLCEAHLEHITRSAQELQLIYPQYFESAPE